MAIYEMEIQSAFAFALVHSVWHIEYEDETVIYDCFVFISCLLIVNSSPDTGSCSLMEGILGSKLVVPAEYTQCYDVDYCYMFSVNIHITENS